MVCIPINLRPFMLLAFLATPFLEASDANHRNLQQQDALISFYDATGGDDWATNSNSIWLSDSESFCDWYNQADPEDVCRDGILRELVLEDNNLVGSLPAAISQLSGLVQLDLEGNELKGSIPTTMSQLVNLVELDLSDNTIEGGLQNIDWNEMVQLSILNLGTNQLTGDLPSEFPISIEELVVPFNNITGTLPGIMFGLPNLEEFDVEFNFISGSIPTDIGLSTTLQYLNVKDNYISGAIPTEIGNVQSLEELRLDDNQLTSTLPTQLGLLTNLVEIQVDQNDDLEGTIPTELGNCVALEEISFAETGLTGTVPTELTKLVNLASLDLSETSLKGEIPEALCASVEELIFDCGGSIGLCGCGCSCDSARATEDEPLWVGSCFSGDAIIQVAIQSPDSIDSGLQLPVGVETKKMKDLKVGDSILSGSGEFSKVYAFGHWNPYRTTEFLQIWTSDKDPANYKQQLQPLEMTKDHLVFAWQNNKDTAKPKSIRADALRVGDLLQTTMGSANVTQITQVTKMGIYAPLTLEGSLVVNDVIASSYVSLHPTSTNESQNSWFGLHSLLHMVLSPFRLVCGSEAASPTNTFCQGKTGTDGMPTVIGRGLNIMQWILEPNDDRRLLRILKNATLAGVLLVTGITYGLEQILQAVLSCDTSTTGKAIVLLITVILIKRK